MTGTSLCLTQCLAVSQAAILADSEEEQQELQAEGGAMEKADTTLDPVPLSSGGVLPRTSKESTPGASSSKEGWYSLLNIYRLPFTCLMPSYTCSYYLTANGI